MNLVDGFHGPGVDVADGLRVQNEVTDGLGGRVDRSPHPTFEEVRVGEEQSALEAVDDDAGGNLGLRVVTDVDETVCRGAEAENGVGGPGGASDDVDDRQ